MVYFTGIPLIMQQTEAGSAQACFNNLQNGEITVAPSTMTSNMQQNSNRAFPQIVNLSNNQQQPQDQLTSAQPNYYQNLSSSVSITNSSSSPPASTQQNNSKFKCEQCNMSFGSKSAHTSHMKSHAKQYSANKLPTMVQANGTITTPTNGSDPYQCDVCKKTFAVPARLVRHYRTHTGERPFECEFCHKMFSVKENLQVHRRIHTKERPYKCEVCGRAFEHSGKLHRHMRIHTGERPHKCNVCGKTFIQSGQLVIHMRTHTGEKPYKCQEEGCGKGFTCSKQLKVHSRTHTGEKPYHCDICFRDFGYNHVLKLHKVQHYGSKCYKCTICDETFKNKKEMEAHIKGHAKDLPDDEDIDNKSGIQTVFNGNSSSMDLTPPPSNISSESMGAITDNSSPSMNEDQIMIDQQQLKDQIQVEEPNENGDIVTYYNMYSRFEQSVVNSYGVQSGVNPALLAVASMASSSFAEHIQKDLVLSTEKMSYPQKKCHQTGSDLDEQLAMSPQSNISSSPSSMNRSHSPLQSMNESSNYVYEPMIMRHGYFASGAQVSEFRSLDTANDIVRRVEAAITPLKYEINQGKYEISGAETLLTPPRSSPESPDRASSPESDSAILMADRDNNTLPPRKRKLYFKDNQNGHSPASSSPHSSSSLSPPTIRVSSVIQYAKAS